MLEEHWTIKNLIGASLMVQWLKTCLLMQRAQVQNLVWEDPTCQGVSLCTATTGAHELQPLKSESPTAYAPQEKPLQWAHAPQPESRPCSPHLPRTLNRRPNAARNKKTHPVE